VGEKRKHSSIKFKDKELKEKMKNKMNRMRVHIGAQKHANCFHQVFLGSGSYDNQLHQCVTSMSVT